MFKVGDKVRITGNGGFKGIIHHYTIGTVGVVEHVSTSAIGVGVGTMYQNISPQHLELVKGERKPKNLKSPKDIIAQSITLEQAMKDDILLMAHLYHKGLSFRDVAKLTNVHERTVRRRFKKYGIPSRGKGSLIDG